MFGAADAYRNPYADVQTNDWYFGAVQYVTENGLMNGTGKGFEPNLATSRAMIWTILARMSDVNTASGGEWYAVAQQWAIANGVSDGTMPERHDHPRAACGDAVPLRCQQGYGQGPCDR